MECWHNSFEETQESNFSEANLGEKEPNRNLQHWTTYIITRLIWNTEKLPLTHQKLTCLS